ncbi:MAG: hypothetical protein ABSF08_10290 [Candidatus Cybelea sp.]
METKVAGPASVRSAFTELIDYAGLFPPAKLSLAQATAEYSEAQRGAHAWMLGRFIIPVTTLTSSPQTGDGPFSVILDRGSDAATWVETIGSGIASVAALRDRGVRVEALEIPLPPAFSQDRSPDEPLQRLRRLLESAKLSDLPVFVEFARGEAWKAVVERAMTAAMDAGCGAKIRCGGLTAEAFPSVDEVAGFIAAAVAANVPFKATAGLHHPIRHYNPQSGFTMHGFLNILAAAALAPRAGFETLRRVVAEEEPSAFQFEAEGLRWRDERIGAEALKACRHCALVAYGSCSFNEPVEDLTALGILAAP